MQHDRTAWLADAGWGVFCHFLASHASAPAAPDLSVTAWNDRVDAFDVNLLADQVAEIGANYLLFTLGQNSGFYCSPNDAYDAVVGIDPSKCSRRDLIADLACALASYDIPLVTYLPSGAPEHDPVAVERLAWENLRQTGIERRLATFQEQWEAVVREWGERWGEDVHGWWIDGCYHPDAMYRHPEPPNFESFAASLRAGNPDRIISFNPGAELPVRPISDHEDYTAGELIHALELGSWRDGYQPVQATVEGAQYHVTTFVGEYWGRGEPRFSDSMVAGYTDYVTDRGGAITWEVPIDDTGNLPIEHREVLAAIE